MTEMISTDAYPGLTNAILWCRNDMGCPSSCAEHGFAFPSDYLVHVPIVEAYFVGLTDDQMMDFCCGEESEVRALRDARPAADLAGAFLDDWYNSWDVTQRTLCHIGERT